MSVTCHCPVHMKSHRGTKREERRALVSHLQGVDCILNDMNPAIPLLFGAGVDLHHLWIFHSHTDEEQTFLLMRHFSYNQLL